MTEPYPGANLTVSDLFHALDAKIFEQITLARSAHRTLNPFTCQVISELRAGVKCLLARIQELKNSFQPAQRLPAEMILEVGTHLNPRSLLHGDCRPLLAASQVCRYWRNMLISNADNWRFISSEYIDLAPLFLGRSGSLSLEVNLTDTHLSDAIQLINPHSSRLAVLRCNVREANSVFFGRLSQLGRSPNLHTFSITSTKVPNEPRGFVEIPVVLDRMFSLRTLELLPFQVFPRSLPCNRLTNLQLEVTYSTLTSVLDFLGANPSLRRVRLIGNFKDSNDTRATGSIVLKHLRFISVERCIPRTLLDKLSLSRTTRIFIHYNLTLGQYLPFVFVLPPSVQRYKCLQELTSLYVLTTRTNETYIDATGRNGSTALRFGDVHDTSPVFTVVGSLPVRGVTRLTCEFHPLVASTSMDKVTRMIEVLPHLEEITVVHFGRERTQHFLSVLMDTSKWTGLLKLKFVHCSRTKHWVGDLIQVAIERKDEVLMLDTVTVVYKEGERVKELFDVLEGFVGTLELVEEREATRSELVWDGDDYTARLTSALIS
ncbi:hypothetical protein BDM02DRAFT_3183673 [Thelephora ganbajun]|uniref:Uncharacterized protein n=1 Tax=Thelephora ganbajun TaxID=370292 RepID=A0ACB6ZT24_THEGA|nr:hypothetical protein BDM02DRAFT_3183673 [Thelephora ganbajun]